MIRITADNKIPFLKGVLEPFARITYLPGSQFDRDVIMDSDALLVRTRTKCSSDLLSGTRVRFIGTATIGFDHIDTGFCNANNIRWTNAPGCNSSSVMQYIAAALMRISSESGLSLSRLTIGIIGVGNVGSKVQKLARTLGMKVLLNDPPRQRKEKQDIFVSIEQVLEESDIITLHVPLNTGGKDNTFHLIDANTLGKVKKGSWLINSSRGEVVEADALKEALTGERIAGAVLDVWEKEPEIDIPLMHMAFLATPHIAGYSADGKANGTSMVVNELCRYFDLPLNDWFPSEVPEPADPVLVIECHGKSLEEIAGRAVSHSYNIMADDVRLRFDPSRFEKERENYPLRREFPSYSIELRDGTEEARALISSLGFRLIG
ncbi:MAG: 4-phosphoerythronate dehydrogenase PdxB [Bacteroidales bacterium]|jgi:erythronate-4-phosphate dehydrogenase|nr:4-phosphoerythronate dehydrogenase PdxB [Bacteroidales bacterium]